MMVAFNNLQFLNREAIDAYGEHPASVFPPNEYQLRIHRVKDANNRAGTGKLLILIFESGGNFTELLLNYPHSDPKTQWHGERQLLEINKAIGITGFNHHRELEGKTLTARVSIDQGSNGYADRNAFEFLAQPVLPIPAGHEVITPGMPQPQSPRVPAAMADPTQPTFWQSP